MYVGSAHDTSKDQTLDEILVGPIPVGVNKFVLQADPPDPTQLPPDEILGVTVALVTCSYREREFIRVGYYVNNEFVDPNPPPIVMGEDGEPIKPVPPKYPQLDLNHVHRQILADKPRVTKFAIPWTEDEAMKEAETKAAAAAAASSATASSPAAAAAGATTTDKDQAMHMQGTPPLLGMEEEDGQPPQSAAHGMNLMPVAGAGGGTAPMDME